MTAEVELTVDEAYRLLKLSPGASEAQIKSAYRKVSLKLHPDKRRDVTPEVAAHDFHQLSAAYALLNDPAQREKAEAKASENAAAAARRGAYDGKRKAAAEDLVRREEEDRKRRRAAAAAQKDLDTRLREAQLESQRMMQEACEKHHASAAPASSAPLSAVNGPENPATSFSPPQVDEDAKGPPLGTMDKLIIAKFPTSESSNLLGVPAEALLSTPALTKLNTLQTPLAQALGNLFGKVNQLLVHPPRRRKKTGGLGSEITVMAEFDNLVDAYAAATVGSKLAAPPPLDECWIGWAIAGKKKSDASSSAPAEPPKVTWMRSRGLLPNVINSERSTASHPSEPPPATTEVPCLNAPSDSFNKRPETRSAGLDFESVTLRRLREAAKRQAEKDDRVTS